MRTAKIITLLGVLLMGLAIGNAFLNGDFGAEGSVLISLPWGIVSLVDLYVGFTLFALWIIYREPIWWHAVIWIVLLMVLGFFIGSLYAFLALQRSGDNWGQFWHGPARESS